MWGTLIDVWVHWGTGGWVEAMGTHTPLPPLLSAPTSRAASPYSGRQGLRPGRFVSHQRGTGEAHTEPPCAVPRQRGDMGHIGGSGSDVEFQQTHSTSVTGAAIAPTSPAASIHLSTCLSIHPAFSQPSGWLSLSIPYRSIHPPVRLSSCLAMDLPSLHSSARPPTVCPFRLDPPACPSFLPNHPSIHPSLDPFIHPSMDAQIHAPVCPSLYASVCPAIPLSIHMSSHLSMSIHPCIGTSIHLSVCPSIHLHPPTCLSIHPSSNSSLSPLSPDSSPHTPPSHGGAPGILAGREEEEEG